MKTTPEPQDDFAFQPQPKPAPVAPKEVWTPIEKGSQIERNQQGQVRTNIPLNNAPA